MGLSVFPAPSTGPSIPEGLRPPKFTYSNNWSLSGLTGMTDFDNATGNLLTYRKTDNSLYFTGRNTQGLYKFDLATKTGSRVSTNMTNASAKDIMAAQDGTLYRATGLEQSGAANYAFSTDGGINWTATGDSSSIQRGWLTVIDNGYFSGLTGNVMFVSRFNSANTEGSRMVVNNTNTGSNNAWQTETRTSTTNFDIIGGCGVFPLRNGDDNIAEKHFILDTTISTTPFGPNDNQGVVYFRYADVSRRWNNTARDWIVSHHVPSYIYSSTNVNNPINGIAPIGRPTSIQSRWIVGVNRFQTTYGASLHIYDYENNFQKVGSVPLRNDASSALTVDGQTFSNPIYISSTKKLYVFYAKASGATVDARMYEYDVTTY